MLVEKGITTGVGLSQRQRKNSKKIENRRCNADTYKGEVAAVAREKCARQAPIGVQAVDPYYTEIGKSPFSNDILSAHACQGFKYQNMMKQSETLPPLHIQKYENKLIL